ncbi:DUF3817 domain-containing protein [Frankia sp. CNm7]|uniref:DUF3817 domain-containing protein n=1 Tax=Frankia nepalensis TaxID=1836974 RepID=A0A937REV9_9ACTN|nr:DUF3817 domain-containing protein [Frankia nepalensis]MBL7502406.1 DUF3817 domain-containing protein [Frankia nepalensis]MBL7516159.1 DUF3817 domain-containing protein [Frankia nepalensis]MBL7523543.1 DUF3817 domain-containing protein [Frankia nepalensis]MBL7628737.1 DUF3817 domain-containing protein [Frankia nepalensis]
MTSPSREPATVTTAPPASDEPRPARTSQPAARVGSATRPVTPAAIAKALGRYRVLAYVVGVVLITLVLVAMPLKYAADTPQLVRAIGPIHGVLYIVYLLATFDLATKARIPGRRMILVMLAGTVPFVSFIAERSVTREVRASAEASAPAS